MLSVSPSVRPSVRVSVCVFVTNHKCPKKLPTHLSYLEIFRKNIFFQKKYFSQNLWFRFWIWIKIFLWPIVLLFHGQCPKNPILRNILKKKKFKILFFQNSLKSNMELKKNISIVVLFYCVMGNAQKISTLVIFLNFIFQMCVPNLIFGKVWRSSRPIFFGWWIFFYLT